MQIIHRVVSFNQPGLKAELGRLGIAGDTREDPELSIVLEIADDDDFWPIVRELARQFDASVSDSVRYSEREIESAEWLRVGATGHHGYPQPEDDSGRLTYADYCPHCGIHGSQKAPFSLRSEPTAKRLHFFQLNWVFDELFVRSEVRVALQQGGITGVNFMPVVKHKTGQPLDSLEQMYITTILPPGLVVDGYEKVLCTSDRDEPTPGFGATAPASHCGRTKFMKPPLGPVRFHRPVIVNAPDIARSAEIIGAGAAADREIIVSRRLATMIREKKWRGLWMEPIELVD